ncbi:MAG: PEP/pyruvate-binding domain-containing protein [Clostridiales Family XIII bacterium]|nr:PEP/pyruvate-binding domain-containing protein [Clostridiales Family XIII bacterium]
MINQKRVSSGLAGFDTALDHIRYGDNVVFQVSDVQEYAFFVEPFIEKSVLEKKNIVFFRFNPKHDFVEPKGRLKIFDIDISLGFETVAMMVADTIEEEGTETHYIFDSLTDLQNEWIADFMMGNFFVITAPQVARTNSVGYYCYTRDYHSFEAVARIRETASILLDIYKKGDEMFLHPVKVQERYLPTIFLPHTIDMNDRDSIEPITNGIALARYFSLVAENGNVDSTLNLDNWERYFLAKSEHADSISEEDLKEMCRMVFGGGEHIQQIAIKNVKIADLLAIKARMIGVGSIGGKATGMILSRMIVERQLPEVAKILEPHDSYYICSNLFYTFLIKNNCWGLKIKQRKKRGYFPVAEILKEKILEGRFSENIREQFRRMLEYFGQSPIIVRSSSLLEDGFGNAFAGKYESVFCVNKGTLEERLEAFEDAVRTVYASTMDDSVLEYRLQRGLSGKDEQMALLVQRVTGSLFRDFYMPTAAGVAFSYNSYRWNPKLDPTAGMIRIVMGLGTRAVDRTSGDYPRIASLDDTSMRAMQSKYVSDFSQHKVDILDLTVNALVTVSLEDIVGKMKPWFRGVMVERDIARETELKRYGLDKQICYTTCENLLRDERFVGAMRSILATVQEEYKYPVDMEFALNISQDGSLVINLLQCRPLQVGGSGIRVRMPEEVDQDKTYFHLTGGTMGGAYYEDIDVVIAIDPKMYYEYPYNQKPAIARVVGQINQLYRDSGKVIMLLVPGRIGTTSPELGVPVRFAEISNMSIACEVSYEGAGYLPELSFGSHFFQDLVEADIFYAAIFENKETTRFYAPKFFADEQNILRELIPDIPEQDAYDIVRVYNMEGKGLRIVSDIQTGETLCGYFDGVKDQDAPQAKEA